MNIKKAKEEIKYAIQAYLAKDEFGEYRIPAVRQRPVLLMGAPGIGKTAVMEQVARECGVALVSYSITHHTRQSAIGLPFISKKEYGGKEYTVTEYTMSEIIASVYDKMEETGLQEGILFIDEINCASETLAPAMLQFLQCKTFGAHKVPEGWLIAAAGNPPEYNKSVREFDVVTLDRVKKIDVEPDFSVWKEYAYKQGIHGAILSYLEIRKDHFYAMETTVDGKRFVTARGWEDLSTILKVYEDMNLPVEEGLIYQYLQHRRIAKDFANYLDLYRKYRTDYRVDDILQGKYTKQAVTKLQDAPFDERLSVMGLFEQAFRGLPRGIRGGFDRNGTAWRAAGAEGAVQQPLLQGNAMGEPLYGTGRGKRSRFCEGTEGGTSGENGGACLLEGIGAAAFLPCGGKTERLSGKGGGVCAGEGTFRKRGGRTGKRHCGCVCDAGQCLCISGGSLRRRAGDGYLYYGADHELL